MIIRLCAQVGKTLTQLKFQYIRLSEAELLIKQDKTERDMGFIYRNSDHLLVGKLFN